MLRKNIFPILITLPSHIYIYIYTHIIYTLQCICTGHNAYIYICIYIHTSIHLSIDQESCFPSIKLLQQWGLEGAGTQHGTPDSESCLAIQHCGVGMNFNGMVSILFFPHQMTILYCIVRMFPNESRIYSLHILTQHRCSRGITFRWK